MKIFKKNILGIVKGEGLSIILLFFIFFLIKASTALFDNFAMVAFLKRYGIKHLPLVYVINSAFVFMFLNALSNFVDQYDRKRLLILLFFLSGVSILFLRIFIISQKLNIIYPIVIIFSEQIHTLFSLSFWLLASEIFTARQSKRLYPLLSAGGILGTVVGSFAASIFSGILSLNNLLFVLVGLFVAGGVYMVLFGNRLSIIKADVFRKKSSDKDKGIFRLLKKSLLLRLMLVVIFIPGLIHPFIDYQFNYLADLNYGSEQSLMVFYGIFKGLFSLLIFVFHLFVTGRLFMKLGLSKVLFFLPLNHLLYFTVTSFGLNFAAGLYGKISSKLLMNTIHNPAKKNLFNFFPDEIRGKVSFFMKGTVSKLGKLSGSGLLLLLIPVLDVDRISLIGIFGSLIGLYGAFIFKKNYSNIVSNSIASRQLNLDDLAERNIIELITPKVEEELKEYLNSGDEAIILIAAKSFIYSNKKRFIEYVLNLFPKYTLSVQKKILEMMSSVIDKDILESISKIANDIKSPLFPYYVKLASIIGSPDSGLLIKKMLRNKNPSMMIFGITSAINYGDVKLRNYGIRKFKSLLNEEAASSNIKASIIRQIKIPELDKLLLKYINHSTPVIKRAIVVALGNMRSRKSLPYILPLLNYQDKILKKICIEALGKLWDKRALNSIVPYLAESNSSIKKAAVNSFRLSGGLAVPILKQVLERHKNLLVIESALELLVETRTTNIDAEIFINKYLIMSYQCLLDLSLLIDKREDTPLILLKRLLEEELLSLKRILVLLLFFLSDGKMIGVIRKGIISADKNEVALAVEAIEDLAPKRFRLPLVGLFEEKNIKVLSEKGKSFYSLKERTIASMIINLIIKGQLLERSVAIYIAGMHGNKGFIPLLERILLLKDSYLCGLAISSMQRIITGSSLMKQELSILDKLLFLEKVPIFEILSIRELTAIAGITDTIDYYKGKIVFAEGDFGDSMFLIVEGAIAIYKQQEHDKVKLADLKVGDCFGEMALFEKKPRSATAIASRNTKLLKINGFEFEEIMKEYPAISINICRIFSKRLRETNEILNSVNQV